MSEFSSSPCTPIELARLSRALALQILFTSHGNETGSFERPENSFCVSRKSRLQFADILGLVTIVKSSVNRQILRNLSLILADNTVWYCATQQSQCSDSENAPRATHTKSRSQTEGQKRPAQDDEDPNAHDSGSEDEIHKRRKPSSPSNETSSGPVRRLACPFFKHDPPAHAQCSGPGWISLARVKYTSCPLGWDLADMFLENTCTADIDDLYCVYVVPTNLRTQHCCLIINAGMISVSAETLHLWRWDSMLNRRLKSRRSGV